ncbi:F0F1 ATP synthase subunit alpha [Hydrogenophaga crassostreae]|uniref:ATP synthase subunit alpha n=1 Tax=Hydrogenophaga crassostreae TaxID=1763535 RepID=A0A162YZL5_9BURK|nr:F0F1 ATP synthase subunit alpha [Hydrogenophaga crassostreae]AOW14968.1 F0F1 ATP synthase subunit alpha [Hydrogenophaga crassostreae]OAD41420.1 F0F1 ATP synthase subunit alpha [Hydrogenophaga crassostreae]
MSERNAPISEVLAPWRSAAWARVSAKPLSPPVFEEIGRVHSVADGIAKITGLAGVRLNELLHFPESRMGYAASLEPDHIACVLLDEPDRVGTGQRVTRGGGVVQVPVGPGLLGRVVDPLGRPLDEGSPIETDEFLPAERPAPSIIQRALVREPVHTGTLAVDALFPLGRGQRELIIGDRGTGKTSVAVDALLAQRDSDLICVYISIGQKSEATAAVIDAVRRLGAPERTIFVVAASTAAPGLQWLAPFSGFSMAEYFRDRGQHALVVIDDLSKHAATHRELALLMQQPPGREAYPGDIFHLHARLLERAAMLSKEQGGGSLTALPIAQTEAGNLAAYIPTNLISITDGQIVLDAKQFHLGQLPAVDTGLSVSRVGGKTQAPLMREAVSSLRLEYAQFLELEQFTRFGTELDPKVHEQIDQGRRIRAALAQPRLAPQTAATQIALVIALQEGLLDNAAPAEIGPAVARLAQALAAHPELGQRLAVRSAVGTQERDKLAEAIRPLLAPVSAA